MWAPNLRRAGIARLHHDDYRQTHTFEKRRDAAAAVRKQYPHRVPVVCQRAASSKLEAPRKTRYLVPRSLTVQQFLFVVRRNAKLSSHQALFLFTGDDHTLAAGTTTIGDLDETRRDADGFVYIFYAEENTFG